MTSSGPVTRQYIEDLARDVMQMIREAGEKTHTIDTKLSRSDLVTESDIAVEKYLINRIKKDHPDHQFISEETSEVVSEIPNAPTWIIDPIDGTTNFIHSHPVHAISIGYAENKTLKMGAVGIPQHHELFSAARGEGAFLNGKRIRVASKVDPGDALCLTGFFVGAVHQSEDPSSSDLKKEQCKQIRKTVIDNFTNLLDTFTDIRRHGACAPDMCYVACGRVDVFCEFGPHEWDVAAGIVILEEAGGCVSGYDGKTIDIFGRSVIGASCPELIEKASSILKLPPVDLKQF